jgi:hypothetical protein
MFFFEKKNQKTFTYSGPRQRVKVFCFFFSKKKTFYPFFPIHSACTKKSIPRV